MTEARGSSEAIFSPLSQLRAIGMLTALPPYLDAGVGKSRLKAIRRSTYSGRLLELTGVYPHAGKETKRRLAPQKRGPKKKIDRSEN